MLILEGYKAEKSKGWSNIAHKEIYDITQHTITGNANVAPFYYNYYKIITEQQNKIWINKYNYVYYINTYVTIWQSLVCSAECKHINDMDIYYAKGKR